MATSWLVASLIAQWGWGQNSCDQHFVDSDIDHPAFDTCPSDFPKVNKSDDGEDCLRDSIANGGMVGIARGDCRKHCCVQDCSKKFVENSNSPGNGQEKCPATAKFVRHVQCRSSESKAQVHCKAEVCCDGGCSEKFVENGLSPGNGQEKCPKTAKFVLDSQCCDGQEQCPGPSVHCKADECCDGRMPCNRKFVNYDQKKDGFVSCPNTTKLWVGAASVSAVVLKDLRCKADTCNEVDDMNECCGIDFTADSANKLAVGLIVAWVIALQ